MLYGRCLSIHAMSRTCHHLDRLVCVTHVTKEVGSYIMNIVKPSTTDSTNLKEKQVTCFGCKVIRESPYNTYLHHETYTLRCRLALSQALKDVFIRWLLIRDQ